MLRCSLRALATNRRAKAWKQGAATSHFADTQRAAAGQVNADGQAVKKPRLGLDGKPLPPPPPSVGRASTASAKAGATFLKLFDVSSLGPLSSMRLWATSVRFSEPLASLTAFYPCAWGVGFGVTAAIVREGADLVILNVPLLPLHLLVMFAIASWSARCAAYLAVDVADRELAGRDPPLLQLSTKAVGSAIIMHVGVGLAVALNMHPLAMKAATATLVPAAAYPFLLHKLSGDGGRALTRGRLAALQLYRSSLGSAGVVVGYMTVLGRCDPAVVAPAFVASLCWLLVVDTLDLLQREEHARSLVGPPLLTEDPKVLLYGLTLPMFAATCAAGYAAGMPVSFYAVATGAVWQMANVVDDVNVNDPWSCRKVQVRAARYGIFIVLAILLGNSMWAALLFAKTTVPDDSYAAMAIETLEGGASPLDMHPDPAPAAQVDSTLAKVLTMNVRPEAQQLAIVDSTWMERLLKPAMVHAKACRERAVAEGRDPDTADLAMPVYMRREFMAENIGGILRNSNALSPETLRALEEAWYNFADHYNIFSRLM